jgi:hypothetical protein
MFSNAITELADELAKNGLSLLEANEWGRRPNIRRILIGDATGRTMAMDEDTVRFGLVIGSLKGPIV